MKTSILIIGFGGDGVKVLGEIIAEVAAFDQKIYVFCHSLYTPASRGDTVISGVVITDDKDAYPYVEKADLILLMPGAQEERTTEHTIIIRVPKIENVPINIMALGMIKKYFPALSLALTLTEENIMKVLKKEFGEKKFAENRKAFEEGKKIRTCF